MKSSRFFAAAAASLLGLVWGAAPTRGQVSTSTPIVVKQKPSKLVWLKAEVIHADAHTIIVREQENERAIHTFTYSPKIQDKMQTIFDQGGYQSGDKVRILYDPEKTVAVKVRGKPSKSS